MALDQRRFAGSCFLQMSCSEASARPDCRALCAPLGVSEAVEPTDGKTDPRILLVRHRSMDVESCAGALARKVLRFGTETRRDTSRDLQHPHEGQAGADVGRLSYGRHHPRPTNTFVVGFAIRGV